MSNELDNEIKSLSKEEKLIILAKWISLGYENEQDPHFKYIKYLWDVFNAHNKKGFENENFESKKSFKDSYKKVGLEGNLYVLKLLEI